ncbi:hypothetical protein F511_31616 [Dorcoceras hygrometricum]|uniref:CCHC-type domain-containing protein n=1 Tax=Dorcoceras hygrometricum TaxID=472368 RepID=A0A2Z7A266_9LAMI|nr:hypothetical protein F511_31616 [Dorcoceras hygrometricum]
MIVDLIRIFELNEQFCTLTMTDWFLQALSVIPRGSWGDVARRFTMVRWVDRKMFFLIHNEFPGALIISVPKALQLFFFPLLLPAVTARAAVALPPAARRQHRRTSLHLICYNCDRPGHFAADCNRPRKDDRYRRDNKKDERHKREEEDDERTVDRSKDKSKDKFKERSKDRRMRNNSNKRPSRKHDRKVLVAEESTKSWADSDSESSSSRSSSSDSEREEVHCLMADQMDDDEVFDFSNAEFTRDDLVTALNDMVKEYRKLSRSFEEVKAENISLQNSSTESSSVELEDVDSLKTELSRLTAEMRC